MGKTVLVLINGHAGVGKDTFATMCGDYAKQEYAPCGFVNIHRSDLPKQALRIMGWNGVKDEESRSLLKTLVDWMESKGEMYQYLYRTLRGLWDDYNIVFYHVRDPQVMYSIIDRYLNDDTVRPISLLVKRDTENQEPADWWDDPENGDYMMTLEIKTGEWDGMRKAAKAFVDFVLSTNWKIEKKEDNYNDTGEQEVDHA